ncbi:MAG: choice-of-anchor Q domain-containing protein [Pseudomonadota bacterium]
MTSATSIQLINNTISQNTAASGVGGLYINGGSAVVNVYNNIVWGNTCTSGTGDIYLTGTGTRNSYNNNYQNKTGLWSNEGNRLNVDPLFVSASSGDYHLGTGSLCLNVGDNSAPGLPSMDLDNNTRICDSTVDLGAYEHCINECHPADLNNDWVITLDEVNNYASAWKSGTVWPKAPNPIHIDYVTRCGYLQKLNSGNYENKGGGKPLCWESKP